MTNQNAILFTVLCISTLGTLTSGRRDSITNWAALKPIQQQYITTKTRDINPAFIISMRGGSTAAEASDETNSDSANADHEGEEQEEEEEDEDEEAKEEKPAAISSLPARLLIQTNWGNTVLDQRVELTTRRTNTVADLKKQVSRSLPGRPPVLGLELVYGGKVLDDEILVDELFDDDEEEEEEIDEEEDDDSSFKILTLNSVPPVDPKFAIELAPKLKFHIEDDEDTLTTEELVEAYFLNQAAMSRNALLLVDPYAPSSPLLRVEIQEQAKQLKEKLKSQVPADVWEASFKAVKRDHNTEEIRGQRYRSGKGGARTSLKKSIQTNLNIDWAETIYNSLLLLFFGFFGGRNSLSRTLMLWGAPLCFILQARPVKMWSKTLFYMLSNPPGVISSLLPAPQQAILNADMEKSYAALYHPDEEKKEKTLRSPKTTNRQVEVATGAERFDIESSYSGEITEADEFEEEEDDTEDEEVDDE